jgi:hypothetical protein
MWVSSPWIPLHYAHGEPYWIQLEGFIVLADGPMGPLPVEWSPGIRCIRVESQPLAIAQSSWGNIKQLYR